MKPDIKNGRLIRIGRLIDHLRYYPTAVAWKVNESRVAVLKKTQKGSGNDQSGRQDRYKHSLLALTKVKILSVVSAT